MREGESIFIAADHILLNIKAKPNARKSRIKGVLGGLVQVDVAAVPEDGKATEALLGFLAKSFGVARRDVALVSGAHARWKRVRIDSPKVMPPELE